MGTLTVAEVSKRKGVSHGIIGRAIVAGELNVVDPRPGNGKCVEVLDDAVLAAWKPRSQRRLKGEKLCNAMEYRHK